MIRGYQVLFDIDRSKMAPNATKLRVDILFRGDKLVFHMRDTVLRIDKPNCKWLSEHRLRAEQETEKGK